MRNKPTNNKIISHVHSNDTKPQDTLFVLLVCVYDVQYPTNEWKADQKRYVCCVQLFFFACIIMNKRCLENLCILCRVSIQWAVCYTLSIDVRLHAGQQCVWHICHKNIAFDRLQMHIECTTTHWGIKHLWQVVERVWRNVPSPCTVRHKVNRCDGLRFKIPLPTNSSLVKPFFHFFLALSPTHVDCMLCVCVWICINI